MNKLYITSLSFKLFAIYSIIQGLSFLPSSINVLSLAPFSEWMILIIGPPIIFIVSGIILWLASDQIAIRLVGESQEVVIGSTIKIKDVQTVAFSIIGLYILARILPEISFIGSQIFWSVIVECNTDLPIKALIEKMTPALLIQFIIGLCLFLYSNKLSNFLNRKTIKDNQH
jgi:hypothetical protein